MVEMWNISYDWLERRNELSPDRTALVDLKSGKHLTYHQLNQRANRLANAFRDSWGIKKGDRIAIMARNSSEFLEALYAVAKIGAILVPINIRLTSEELKYILGNCNPNGIIFNGEFIEIISAVKKEIKIPNNLLIGEPRISGVDLYENFLELSNDETPALTEPNTLADVQVVMYTSGTTGNPKGSIMTHGNILFNAVNAMHNTPLLPSNKFLCALPLFHTGGMNVFTNPTIYTGGTVYLMDQFDAGEVLRLVRDKEVNMLFFVATQWLFISQHMDFEKTDFSGIRVALSGGEPCPLPVLEACHRKGLALGQGFGMTESGPNSTYLRGEDAMEKIGSSGLPTFHTDLRIVNDDGIDVIQGETGEIILRSPSITKGYWNNPEATKEAIKNGWYFTGDIGYKDKDGFLYVRGRKKDMIISGGENIYPAEVEKVLLQNSKIAEAAVFGVPNEKWGEVGHAVVCPRAGETLIEEGVINFLQGKLARFKIPKTVSFAETLPKSSTGKLIKRTLKDEYLKMIVKK